jgi:DNA-binding response OmpR family regulator
MVSADATQGQIDRLATAGAQNYFTKPLDVKKLLAFVDATLQRATGEQLAGPLLN